MREWFIKWLGLDTKPQQAAIVAPALEEKTCEKDGHEWGRVKMWGGLPNRRCVRCQKLENDPA